MYEFQKVIQPETNEAPVKNRIEEIHSEEIQEIFGKVPPWLIRRGILFIFSTVIILLGGSWFFKYPETVASSITITTPQPPVLVYAKTDGQIQEILIQANQKVKKGDVLAIIKNTTDYKDVCLLKEFIENNPPLPGNTLNANDKDIKSPVLKIPFKGFNFGSLTPAYNSFIGCYSAYLNFLHSNPHKQKTEALKLQVKNLKSISRRLEEETQISQKHTSEMNLLAVESQLLQMEYNILATEVKYADDLQKIKKELKDAVTNLNTAIAEWESKYLFIAPVDGYVNYSHPYKHNLDVKAGDKVLTITPVNKQEIKGFIDLPVKYSAKVKSGQTVHIKLNNYPYAEYGMVKGIIATVLPASNNDYYIAEVTLPDGLKTNYKKQLDFKYNMKGTAEIITEDKRLFDEIIKPFKSAILNNNISH